MKKEYRMYLDEREVKLSLSRKSVRLNDRKLDVRTTSIGKHREKSTFQVILYLLAVMAAGVIVYASISAVVSSDDEVSPYIDLEYGTVVPVKEAGMSSGQYASARDGYGFWHDLGGSNIEFDDNGADIITLEQDLEGETQFYVSFQGSAYDIKERGISILRIMFDAPVNYTINGLSFIATDDDDTILRSYGKSVPDDMASKIWLGRNVFDIRIKNMEFLEARDIQEDEVSSHRGMRIGILLPEGMPAGEYRLNVQWGPDYRHDITTVGLMIGGASLLGTALVLVIVYRKVSRYDPCLILDTQEKEYKLFGRNEDISELYLSISRITIPRMTESETRKKERPGITKGDSLVDGDEAKQIGRELKKRPGGSGKMIVHQCPECMGTELYYETGFLTGYKYHCKNCDYVGSFVIEKQVNFDQ